jgi:hypothetical protein
MTDDVTRGVADDMPVMLGDLISAMGRGLADAQRALDAAAIDQIRSLGESTDEIARLARELGYQPNWYRIPELDADISLSLTVEARSRSTTQLRSVELYATPVDATFSNRYDVTSDMTTRVRFKVVPVPRLVGAEYLAATDALEAAGLEHRTQVDPTSARRDAIGNITSDTKVTSSDPAGGEVVRRGTTVVLELESPDPDPSSATAGAHAQGGGS